MKRFAQLLVYGGFFFILSVPAKQNHNRPFLPAQYGPFPTEKQCDDMAALFTTVSSASAGFNPFWVPNSVATACWSNEHN